MLYIYIVLLWQVHPISPSPLDTGKFAQALGQYTYINIQHLPQLQFVSNFRIRGELWTFISYMHGKFSSVLIQLDFKSILNKSRYSFLTGTFTDYKHLYYLFIINLYMPLILKFETN